MKEMRSLTMALGLASTLAMSPGVARADDSDGLEQAGWGALAMLSTIVYGPVKLVYAASGGVVGGLAYLLTGGNEDVAMPVLDAAVLGDYYITPAQLRAEETIEFVGRGDDSAQGVASEGESDRDGF